MKLTLAVFISAVLVDSGTLPEIRKGVPEPNQAFEVIGDGSTGGEIVLVDGFWDDLWAEVEKSKQEKARKKVSAERVERARKAFNKKKFEEESQKRLEANREANPNWKCYGIEKSVKYSSCAEAGRKTALPIKKCTPGYSGALDSDHDGWACE